MSPRDTSETGLEFSDKRTVLDAAETAFACQPPSILFRAHLYRFCVGARFFLVTIWSKVSCTYTKGSVLEQLGMNGHGDGLGWV